MSTERRLDRVKPFVPLHPVPRRRLIALVIVGPFLWLAALLVTAIVLHRTDAIELGLVIALGCVALSVFVLTFVRALRNRERRRFADRR